MNKIKLAISALCLMLVTAAMAQHHEIHEPTHEEHGKHKVAFYAGFTHVSAAFYEHETHQESTGKWIPTLGLEYYYTLSHSFDIGLVADMELDKYYIHTEDHNNLMRNNIVIAAAVARYKPAKHLGLFAGPGFETEFIGEEESKSFMVLKAGIDYEVEIENGWELTPIFSYDFKEHYSSYSFGISLGKRF